MAGILNVDTLKADSNLKFQIASANVAFIDSTGLNVVSGNLTIAGNTVSPSALSLVNSAFNANGTINAATIASVNANTITSGTIPSARIPRLATSNLPAGTVLQCVTSVSTTTFSSSTASWQDIGVSITYTPISATSVIVVQFIGAFWQTSQSAYSSVRLVNTGGNSSTIGTFSDIYYTGSGAISWGFPLTTYYTSGTTSSVTTKVQVYPTTNGIWFNNNSNTNSPDVRSSFVVWEIAA